MKQRRYSWIVVVVDTDELSAAEEGLRASIPTGPRNYFWFKGTGTLGLLRRELRRRARSHAASRRDANR